MKLSFALSSLLILFASEVWALEPCPDNQPKEKWDNCTGTATYTSGKYVGEWKDGKLQGQGTYTSDHGFKYVGEYKDGKRNGQGTYTFASGEKYVGEHKDDKRHGQGTHTYANGDKYDGEHKDDKRHGQGTYTFVFGAIYVGEYKDNNMHGQGTFTHGNAKYVGEHKDNNMHGQGTYTCVDGRVYEGRWRRNRLLRQTIHQNCYSGSFNQESIQLSQESIQLSKQALIAEYIERCIGFGFEGKTEIAACIQQEVFNERQLAQQRLAQQPQLAQEEEVPFLLQMLGEIAIGVSEGYLEKVQHDIMHQNDRRPPIIFNPPKP